MSPAFLLLATFILGFLVAIIFIIVCGSKKKFWVKLKDEFCENLARYLVQHMVRYLVLFILILIAVIITIVFFREILDNAEDTATKAGLRSVATLYAEVLAENHQNSANSLSLCRNKKVQRKMDIIFGHSASTLLVGNQDRYVDLTISSGGVFWSTILTKYTKNGCVSNADGEWVAWADLSRGTGRAWCVDSSGRDREVKAGKESNDKYAIKVNGGALEEVSCKSLKKGLFWGHL